MVVAEAAAVLQPGSNICPKLEGKVGAGGGLRSAMSQRVLQTRQWVHAGHDCSAADQHAHTLARLVVYPARAGSTNAETVEGQEKFGFQAACVWWWFVA
jgi:hypothetical protein